MAAKEEKERLEKLSEEARLEEEKKAALEIETKSKLEAEASKDKEAEPVAEVNTLL